MFDTHHLSEPTTHCWCRDHSTPVLQMERVTQRSEDHASIYKELEQNPNSVLSGSQARDLNYPTLMTLGLLGTTSTRRLCHSFIGLYNQDSTMLSVRPLCARLSLGPGASLTKAPWTLPSLELECTG